MSKSYNAQAETTVTITNIYDPEAEVVNALEVLDTVKYDSLWNTGLDMLASEEAPALVKDTQAWEAKHIASIRLYKSNSYVFLEPGDSFTLVTRSPEESLYYGTMAGEFIEVVSDPLVVDDDDYEDYEDYEDDPEVEDDDEDESESI